MKGNQYIMLRMTHYRVEKSFLSPWITYIYSLWVWDYNELLHLYLKNRTKIIIELHNKSKRRLKNNVSVQRGALNHEDQNHKSSPELL